MTENKSWLKNIKWLSNRNIGVNNLRLSDGEFNYCETCEVAKSKHLPTQRKEYFKPRDFGEVISIDIDFGPCESVEGYN